jgi:hypothetical protein
MMRAEKSRPKRVLGAQMGIDLNVVSRLITGPTEAILRAILSLSR